MTKEYITWRGYHIDIFPDGSCTALGQRPFANLDEAKHAIRSYMKNIECKNSLAPLPKCWEVPMACEVSCEQEGKTPMRYNDNYASASASVQALQSDVSIQRDYLLRRLEKAKHPKEVELAKTFNLYVDNTPANYQELIAAIKGGTYTIDPKIAAKFAADPDDYRYCGALYGIVWSGPQPDRKGYDAALAALALQQVAAKDTIMVSDAATGLAALQAFEAWVPAPTTAS